MLTFEKKVIFCTGSGGHIAKTAAEIFIRQGAKVVSTDVTFPKIDLSLVDFSRNPVEIYLDVTDRKQVFNTISLVAEKLGQIDSVINAAGIAGITPFLDITEEEWDRVFAINAKGMFFVCQAALRQMIEQKGGCFVNFASISGKVGGVLAGADYSASKAAVICLTKSLAKSGAPYGIRANSIAPSAIYSPILNIYDKDHAEAMKGYEKDHPFGRFGNAEEVANTVVFLASDEASFISGACVDINGGTLMD